MPKKASVKRLRYRIVDLGSGNFPTPNPNTIVRAADSMIHYPKRGELGGASVSQYSRHEEMRVREQQLRKLYRQRLESLR